jgi:hypothetical protein
MFLELLYIQSYGCGHTIFLFKIDVRGDCPGPTKFGRWLVDQRYQMESDMASQTSPVFEALVQNSPAIQGAYTKDGTFENAPTPKS